MSTITSFLTGQQELKRLGGEILVAENALDFSATNVAGSDVVQAVKIPAGAIVLDVWLRVGTVEDSTATLDIGDATDPNGWDAAVDAEALALTIGDGAYAGGKYYSAADTIDIVPSAGLDTAVVQVFAKYFITEVI